MYKSQGAGVGHRRTLVREAVVAEEDILSLLAAYNADIRYQLGIFNFSP